MAGVSLSTSDNGRKRLLFFDINDRTNRRQIALGKIPKAEAETIKRNVEKLRAARLANTTAPDAISDWLAGLPNDWHEKLEAAGFVDPRIVVERSIPTLGELVEKFKQQAQWNRNSEGTRDTYIRSFDRMFKRFPSHLPITDITAGHAKDFRPFLEADKPKGCGLAVSTASATITQAKTLFELAIDYEMIDRNPFRKIPTPQHDAPKTFVPRAMAMDIMKELPTLQWRLAFALARWGGLRVVSELVKMTWSHVDVDNMEITVLSPKTARHPNGGSRIVPLFEEIEPLIRQCYDDAPDGEVYVLPKVRKRRGNFRDILERAIKRAGYTQWPELFNSLRSTRETELCQLGIPLSEVAEIIGHSVRIAEKNYLQQMGRDRRQKMLAKARTESHAETNGNDGKPQETKPAAEAAESH